MHFVPHGKLRAAERPLQYGAEPIVPALKTWPLVYRPETGTLRLGLFVSELYTNRSSLNFPFLRPVDSNRSRCCLFVLFLPHKVPWYFALKTHSKSICVSYSKNLAKNISLVLVEVQMHNASSAVLARGLLYLM